MRVNGKQITIDAGITISELLMQQGYDSQRVAVEKNGRIIQKNNFDTETLSDSDTIEVVQFVGGG